MADDKNVNEALTLLNGLYEELCMAHDKGVHQTCIKEKVDALCNAVVEMKDTMESVDYTLHMISETLGNIEGLLADRS